MVHVNMLKKWFPSLTLAGYVNDELFRLRPRMSAYSMSMCAIEHLKQCHVVCFFLKEHSYICSFRLKNSR